MEKRWVKRKMSKALTMITLTSTMALMSPLIIQTGSIVYAVSQDQATILADTEVGKLAYTYQADETNINWSLSVDEKGAAESAYLRLKIDAIDTITVAGQSIGKDEAGWFVLDAATGSTKAYQVDFATINNGSQDLLVSAELITPGEENAEDQVQSLVTNGTLKAEIPVVTELPEVETDPTEALENTVAGENGEVGAETVVEEEPEEAPPADAEPDVDTGDASEGEHSTAEVMPFGVSSKVTNGIKNSSGASIISDSTSIGNNYAIADEVITFTSSFTLSRDPNHQDYKWGFTIDTTTIDITTLKLYRKIGTGTEEQVRNPSITNGKYMVALSNPQNTTTYQYRITAKAKAQQDRDVKGSFSSQVTYLAWEGFMGWGEWKTKTSLDQDNYWVKKADRPTYLSWDKIGDNNAITPGKTVANHNPDTAYNGSFYWKDLDTSKGITYRVYKGDTQVGTDLTGGAGTSGPIGFSIPVDKLNSGSNEFTIRAYKDQTEIDKSKRLTLTINCDSPTVLGWNKDASQKDLKETKDIADLTTGYAGTFYWKDQDTSDNKPGVLTFKVLKTVSGAESDVATATQSTDGSGTFTIPSNELTYGVKNFTVQAYKGNVKTGAPITLQITVSGSVKLKSVPTALSWNLTVDQSKGNAISRSESMKLEIQDSRSATDKGANPWKLTVSSQLLEDTPFSLVWKDGETPVDVTGDGVKLQKTGSWTSTGFVDSKTYEANQGILLKSAEYLPVDTWNHTGAITWSLNNVGTTE